MAGPAAKLKTQSWEVAVGVWGWVAVEEKEQVMEERVLLVTRKALLERVVVGRGV